MSCDLRQHKKVNTTEHGGWGQRLLRDEGNAYAGKLCDRRNAQTRTVAVFSDIHSNYHAFKACFDDAVRCGADSFIFLGDYISDLAEPQKTMDLVYKIQAGYPTFCLRGNRERYMLDCEKGISSFSVGSKSGSLLYTYEKLRQRDLDF